MGLGAGVSVGVGAPVGVKDGVDVGTSVGVKVGVIVGGGVGVTGRHGSQSFCPAMIVLLAKQLARLIANTVVRQLSASE